MDSYVLVSANEHGRDQLRDLVQSRLHNIGACAKLGETLEDVALLGDSLA